MSCTTTSTSAATRRVVPRPGEEVRVAPPAANTTINTHPQHRSTPARAHPALLQTGNSRSYSCHSIIGRTVCAPGTTAARASLHLAAAAAQWWWHPLAPMTVLSAQTARLSPARVCPQTQPSVLSRRTRCPAVSSSSGGADNRQGCLCRSC